MMGGKPIITLLLAVNVLIAPVASSAQIIQLPDCNLNPDHPFCDCSFNPGPWCEEPEPERDPIVLVPPLISSYNKKLMKKDEPGGELRFVFRGNTFSALIKKLEEVGYELDEDLFVAHYDWRQSNDISAVQNLKPKIDEVKTETGASKVDLVAHSMGGLVARSYIQSDAYDGDVDQLVTLGTPHAGASGAYQAWEGGQYPETWTSGIIFHINRIEGALKKTRNMRDATRPNTFRSFFPSLKDLLPVDPVVTRNGEDVAITDLTEQNYFLQNLRSAFNLIADRGVELATVGGKDQNTLAEVSLIEERTTEDNQRDRWRDGHANPDPPTANSTDGDQTVLLTSAHVGNNNTTLTGTDHMNLPTAAQDAVLELLELEIVEEHFEYEPPKKLFGITILSPLKAEIVGPNGEVLSQDQNTFGEDMAEYDDDLNDPDDPIEITLANPPAGEYEITYTGTGEGEYTIITTYADEDETVSSVKDGETHFGEVVTETISVTEDTTSLIDDEDYQALLREIVELAKQAKDDNGIAGHELANIVQRVVRAQADLKLYERALTKDRDHLANFWLARYYHNLDGLVQQVEQIAAGLPQQPPRRIFGRFRDRDNDNIDEQVRTEFAHQLTQVLEKIQQYSPPR